MPKVLFVFSLSNVILYTQVNTRVYRVYIKINDNCAISNSPVLADHYFIRVEETAAIEVEYNSNFVISENVQRAIIEAPLSEIYLRGAQSDKGVWLFTLIESNIQQENKHDHSENDKGVFRLGALRLHLR